MKEPKCSVDRCGDDATCEVILFDVYMHDGSVFFERDFTCPYLCSKHVLENERGAEGERRPRNVVRYPFTNKHAAQGLTIYRPLEGVPQQTDARD